MNIYENVEAFQRPHKAVVAIGTFDGVHLGHQQLLQQLLTDAHKAGSDAFVVTFWPHPRMVLAQTHTTLSQLLTSFEEKVAILASLGINHLLKIKFTKKFSQLSAQAFIQQVLIKQIGMTQLVIGYDHRFGKDRTGNEALLQEEGLRHGFTVNKVPPFMVDNIVVSSTKIRELLLVGNVAKARAYLGRPYEIHCAFSQQEPGSSKHHTKIRIAPTNPHKLIPPDGHYIVRVIHQDAVYEGNLRIVHKNNVPDMELTIPNYSSTTLQPSSLCIQFKK